MKMLKPCPMCGWNRVAQMGKDYDRFNRPYRYFYRCVICGFTSKKSAFMWKARRNWNKVKPNSKKNRHHIFGLEF